MARKTIEVETVRGLANTFLGSSDETVTADTRRGVASLLEQVLHGADRYRGFRYVDGASGKVDESRRFYY